jgi:hypothetical protein
MGMNDSYVKPVPHSDGGFGTFAARWLVGWKIARADCVI